MISSFCNWGECVQVDPAPGGGVYVRRKVTGYGAMTTKPLLFSPAEWDAFIAGAKAGEFDRDRLSASQNPSKAGGVG
jgi:hypothetical protein